MSTSVSVFGDIVNTPLNNLLEHNMCHLVKNIIQDLLYIRLYRVASKK